MLRSMTGFGKTLCQLDNKSVVIEVRSLNSKTLDISMKLPPVYRGFEQELRNMISAQLSRGKIELYIGFENGASQTETTINHALVEKYYLEITELARKLGAPDSSDLLPALLRMPDAFTQPASDNSQQEWEAIRPEVLKALQAADAFRISEGMHLHNDIRQRTGQIRALLGQIDPLEENRKDTIKNRLLKGLLEIRENAQPDPNRFEQELIYYLEKLDISEEKVRLTKHLEYFEETLEEEDSSGKKLGFIAQEIGREINTIGSKANDAGIQKIVVQMKDELEKIKEQLMNIL